MLASSMRGSRKFCQRGFHFFYLDQNSSISGPSFAFRRRTDRDDGPIALCFLGNPDQYCSETDINMHRIRVCISEYDIQAP